MATLTYSPKSYEFLITFVFVGWVDRIILRHFYQRHFFSCEDAALQVLMSVCVCVSVVNLKIYLPTSF